MNHPSFGHVPPEAFARAMAAPALKATNILREYVPSFGMSSTANGEALKVPSGLLENVFVPEYKVAA